MRSCIVDCIRSDCLIDEEADDGEEGMRKGGETIVDCIDARIACFLPCKLDTSVELSRGEIEEY